MALLSMRADMFWKKTGKKITIQGSDAAGRESYKKEPKVEEPSHKAMMAIDGIGWDWSFMDEENESSENQALVAKEVVPTEFALMAMSSSSSDNEIPLLKVKKSGLRTKKGVGFDEYRAVPPPPAQVYSSLMPDLSWTGLPEFADLNTVMGLY
ncbi:hypothetical protein Tco_0747556 [Tanacetum coccineum]|uniref:Uncharacterized protein n=1 Tax=Tanacetum coccineum TaxID=301880 RepID=A0ABQ4YTD5_9ASTR